MQLFEMQGLLAGTCLPGDMKVNESLAEYLLRKLEDRNELERQLSAKTISEQNIINAFGISGEGAHSKLVIEYVHGLVAENAELKLIINEVGDLSLSPHIQKLCEIKTPNTDAFTAEIRAQGVDALINSIMNETGLSSDWPMEELRAFAANLRAGRKG